jgi:hypothetical protein
MTSACGSPVRVLRQLQRGGHGQELSARETHIFTLLSIYIEHMRALLALQDNPTELLRDSTSVQNGRMANVVMVIHLHLMLRHSSSTHFPPYAAGKSGCTVQF